MELFITLVLPLAIAWWAKAQHQQQRIAILSRFLSRYTIEKNIETVTQGYLRALGEADPDRQGQIWRLLHASEAELCRQVTQLAVDFAAAGDAVTRVSKLPIWVPFAHALAGSFDMREALRVHARGICQSIDVNTPDAARERAFAISAELLLLQHTCHWFCRSKLVASGRMLARHQTSYEQLVAAILPQTRSAYGRLVSLARSG